MKVIRVKGAYDSASRSAQAMRSWQGADYLSGDAALRPNVRRLINSRARLECENNGYVAGIVETVADDTVGTGPRLQLYANSINNATLTKIEKRWQRWCAAVDLASKLRIARMTKLRDGEVFLRVVRNSHIEGACKLDLVLYEAEQVSSGFADMLPQFYDNGNVKEWDGILYDRHGQPENYRFFRIHPGSFGAGGLFPGESYLVPANQVLHYANILRPGQHRGVSELSPTLSVFNDCREFSAATITAAKTAAELSLVMKTDSPAPEGDDAVNFMDVIELQRNSAVALPDNWDITQIKAEHPLDSYCDFMDAKLCEAARALGVPFAIAKGDSSKSNYASGRLDFQRYHRRIYTERGYIERTILNRLLAIFGVFDRIAYPADYNEEAVEAHWCWDGFEHVDPVKEANADAINLANGTTSVRELCERQGKDFDAVTRDRAREHRIFKKLGLDATSAANNKPNETEE